MEEKSKPRASLFPPKLYLQIELFRPLRPKLYLEIELPKKHPKKLYLQIEFSHFKLNLRCTFRGIHAPAGRFLPRKLHLQVHDSNALPIRALIESSRSQSKNVHLKVIGAHLEIIAQCTWKSSRGSSPAEP
jgi:hypothetical protein